MKQGVFFKSVLVALNNNYKIYQGHRNEET